MTKHDLCEEIDNRAFLVLKAREIVLWAGSLTEPGEEIGGTGVQLQRAARLLKRPYGQIWRAYQRRCGPEIFPDLQLAERELVADLARQARRQRNIDSGMLRPGILFRKQEAAS